MSDTERVLSIICLLSCQHLSSYATIWKNTTMLVTAMSVIISIFVNEYSEEMDGHTERNIHFTPNVYFLC